MITPEDPRHGGPDGYRAGCRDTCCRTGIARYNEARRLAALNGQPTTDLVPALGTRRRIQALAALGWSFAQIGNLVGTDRTRIRGLLTQARVTPDLEARIVHAYDQLSMRIPTGHDGSITRIRNWATAQGWAPPLAWEDVDIDDPKVRPCRHLRKGQAPGGIDHARIERRLAGDRSVRLSHEEAAEVTRRALARGMGPAEIENELGLKPERYATEEAA